MIGGDAKVTITSINSVVIGEGLKVEFEFEITAPGFGGLWGAAERVIPWPMNAIPGDDGA